MIYWNLFVAFFRANMLGYGGGPSTIPLIHREVVRTFHWLTDDEFAEMLAIGNTLPGPIATKIAGYIGYRRAGLVGSLIAICATILPTVLLMIFLLMALTTFQESARGKNMIAAITPAIGVMLGLLAYEFFQKAWTGLGIYPAILFTIVSLVALQMLEIHPAVLMFLFLIYGLVSGSVSHVSRKKNGRWVDFNQGG